ncbi:hypothetical protein GOV14_00550 [Candidatus Pacearchaeota archaeon]|nr:hypothetical protein [Candidatus Pacearchaeota archaeon]
MENEEKNMDKDIQEHAHEHEHDDKCGCGPGTFIDSCVFPPCPKCDKGYLLPFSYKEDVFEKWKCSECMYTIEKREKR